MRERGMVWGPFAETKRPPRAGPKPRSNKNHLTKDPGFPLTTASMTTQRLKVSACINMKYSMNENKRGSLCKYR